MPMRSQAQRWLLHAKHPAVAERFEAHTPKGADLPERVSQVRKLAARRKARRHVDHSDCDIED